MSQKLYWAHQERQSERKRTRRRCRIKKPREGSANVDAFDQKEQKFELYCSLRCSIYTTLVPDPRGEHLPPLTTTAAHHVTIMNWDGHILLDTRVTHRDSAKCKQDDDALTLEQVRSKVANLIKNKILIGHGLDVDLGALQLTHPWCDVRDAAAFEPYMLQHGTRFFPRDLMDLTRQYLRQELSLMSTLTLVDQARCALELYKLARVEWETKLREEMQHKERQRQMVLHMRTTKRNETLLEEYNGDVSTTHTTFSAFANKQGDESDSSTGGYVQPAVYTATGRQIDILCDDLTSSATCSDDWQQQSSLTTSSSSALWEPNASSASILAIPLTDTTTHASVEFHTHLTIAAAPPHISNSDLQLLFSEEEMLPSHLLADLNEPEPTLWVQRFGGSEMERDFTCPNNQL
jgi:hypothetical protein